MGPVEINPGDQLSSRWISIWRIVQIAVWLLGVGILICLLFFPTIGLILFWNMLIPVAPALFVVAAGVWRNICPLATTNLLPRRLGFSKARMLSAKHLGLLNLIAVIAFYLIVPLRHAVFNHNGVATGTMIVAMAAIGVTLGFFFEWKSAWCSGLCPVHPVEKLYGGNVFLSVPNANCDQCMHCVIPCPDSTPNINPNITAKTIYHKLSASLIVGGLPGFIWGWFHVPDEAQMASFPTFLDVYLMPLEGFAVTLAAYLFLSSVIPAKYARGLTGIFAASGVSCYYWYRLPSLLGFGQFADDGLLINLRGMLPAWSLSALTIATTVFFFYWLVIRKKTNRSWVIRPRSGRKADDLNAISSV